MRKVFVIAVAVAIIMTFVPSGMNDAKGAANVSPNRQILVITEEIVKGEIACDTLSTLDALPAAPARDPIGVLIDNRLLTKASPSDLAKLKSHYDSGKAVVFFGDGTVPNIVSNRLGIYMKQEYRITDKSQLLAEGIMKLEDGRSHSIHVTAPIEDKVSIEEISKLVSELINMSEAELRALDLEDGVSLRSVGWIITASTIRTQYCGSMGQYTTSAAQYYLDNSYDGDPVRDYWQLRAQHTSVAGTHDFAMANTLIDPGNSQAIVEYGPTGNYTNGGGVSSGLTMPLPAVSFSFSLGAYKTTLANQSIPSYPRIRHEIKYAAGSPEATGSLAWLQSINMSAPQGQSTIFHWFVNNLRIYVSAYYDDWYWVVSK